MRRPSQVGRTPVANNQDRCRIPLPRALPRTCRSDSASVAAPGFQRSRWYASSTCQKADGGLTLPRGRRGVGHIYVLRPVGIR